LAVEAQFQSVVTPNPETVFSPIIFTQALDENWQPISASEVFTNPVGHMYALFSYDQMIPGSQWTAIWYFGNELVHFETSPWEGGTGGLGYSDWEPDPAKWLSGEYEVQIFLGLTFKVSGRFTVTGDPPTPVPSQTSTPTRTQTPTPTMTMTRAPTDTPRPSDTHQPSASPTPTPTKGTLFPTATYTHAPTYTPWPTQPTPTHAPTYTTAPTFIPPTHQPTNTPNPY
jgi:type VI secretion system secreted protein VgrG